MANDEEFCKCLIEQNDEDMDTECEQLESDCYTDSAKNSSADVATRAMNMESESMECSNISDSDVFSISLHKLGTLACQNGFTIHPVPSDGNCMFSAISYQLQSTGVCNVDNNEMVADYLEANAASYCDFLSQPVACCDAYNADTETPTTTDEYINNVADPRLQIQLKWEKYLRCLRQGGWGDHITMQGIADMLSVKINVLCSHVRSNPQ